MTHLHKIAGEIMHYFNAFKGSRPAMDNGKILIVRGVSADNLKIKEIDVKLNEIVKELDGNNIDVISDDAAKIINRMDEQVRSSIEVNATTDSNGILRMTKDLESQGLTVNFRMFNVKNAGVFIVLWKDKHDVGPCFIEVTVSDNEA